MIKKNITFMYAGKRNYVRGTDIFLRVLDDLMDDDLTDIRFTFNSLVASNECALYVDDDEHGLVGIDGVKARGSVCRSGAYSYFVLQELPGGNSKVESYSFDEDSIIKNASFQELTAQHPASSVNSPIEIVVAITKALHGRVYPSDAGKWIVTKIELDRLIASQDAIKVVICHNFHMKLTKSEILANGNHIGHIYFSLVAM